MMFRWIVAALVVCATAVSAQTREPVFDPLNAPDPAPREQAVKPVATPPAPAVAAKPTQAVVAKPVPAVVPAGPRKVAYEELEGQIGKSIVIKTNLRTTRKGTLKRFNRAGLVIEDMSRGFAMNIDIPRSTVVEVTVVN